MNDTQKNKCNHKYSECQREGKAYWFQCARCGHRIFGELTGK